MSLFKNIRFYILLFSALLATSIYLWVKTTIPEGTLQTIKLTQIYGLISITYLYLALLATPLTKFFNFPFKNKYLIARRSIGVSAFFFGLLHSLISFFGQLGGFLGLTFLDNKYLFSVVIGFIALTIMSLMALTSFDFAVEKLTFSRWKALHKFVYLAGILILVHTLILGSHFAQISDIIPQILVVALIFLFALEAFRIDKYLITKFPTLPKFGITLVILGVIMGGLLFYIFVPTNSVPSLSIHAAHIQLAKQAQSGNTNFPGLQGDPSRRFTVSFNNPEINNPNQTADSLFKVYDANSGNPVGLFSRIYEKVAHLIIVDSELKYFNHIHPDQTLDGFKINNQFPHLGQYHLYLDFQPLGAIEQQFGFTQNVGQVETPTLANFIPDTNLTKVFNNKYQVSLSFPPPLKSQEMSVGNQKLTFTLKDAQTSQPIINLKPYLASFGHLVMINQKTYDYLHVHPTNLTAPKPDENGGPTVEFIPLGLYGPIKPGIYRVFAQFNPDNNLFTADFTVEVK